MMRRPIRQADRSVTMDLIVYCILFFVMAPTIIVIPMAFTSADYMSFPTPGLSLRWFEAFFSSAEWVGATRFSINIAILTAILTSAIGTMAVYAMVRGRGWIAKLFQLAVLGPIIVPHIALAVALYLFFQQIGLSGTLAGYVFAHTVIAMPFVVLTIGAALSKIDPSLEDAAMSCGASRFRAFRYVTFPMILPNVISGGLFAFVISFDEPVITFFLSGIRDKTLPRLLFDNIEQNLTPIIPAVATLLTLLSVIVLVITGLIGRAATKRG